MIKEKYLYWLNNENLEPSLKEELEQMNEKAINDAFYTNIEFGTAGMRGVMGTGPNRINIHTIRKANEGFGNYIVQNGEEAMQRGVAIGYDNRHQSYEFALDTAKYLSGKGIKVYLCKTLTPTPELSFAVRYYNCFGGVMITASHNPKEYNGYKLYDETGCQLIPAIASQVIALVNAVEDPISLVPTPNNDLIVEVKEELDKEYYEAVMGIRLNPDLNKDIKVVFSPEHGASNAAVCYTIKEAGYDLILVEEQATPDPDFSNTKTPNPEELAAYELSLEYAKKYDADLILVCDPDGDRMGVGVKHQNEYEILTGNQTGAILMEYIFSQLTEKNILPENPIMFNTIVTSDIGEAVASNYKIETEKTLTGFKFIGEKVELYTKAQSKNYVFGYEESYGSLISPFVRDKDATQACLMLAEACNYYKGNNKTLVDVLEDIYAREGYYLDTQTSITLQGQEGAIKLQALIKSFRENPLEVIADYKVKGYEDYGLLVKVDGDNKTNIEGFTKADVLKYYLEDGGFIAIRPSGTEPKCKFYYSIKASDKATAQTKFEKISNAIDTLVKG